jgi:hypothetical protein
LSPLESPGVHPGRGDTVVTSPHGPSALPTEDLLGTSDG